VTLATDVTGLRKGIDLILYEREKQPANFVIFTFYNNAVHKVAHVSEQFKIMQEAYDQVCTAFNESSSMVEPFDFFIIFDKFAKNFKKCMAENAERAKAPATKIVAASGITPKDLEKFRFFFGGGGGGRGIFEFSSTC
jgi:hypothetical protein